MNEFKDKVVLVTGGANGMGTELAKQMVAEDAKVIIADINEKAGEEVVASIKGTAQDANVQFMSVDISKPESCSELVDKIVKQFGRLDCLGHCAGVLSNGPFVDVPQKDVDFVIDINLKGTMYILQPVGRQMLAQGGGKICCVSSKAGKTAMATLAHYSASKFGVIGIVQAAAMEWSRRGVHVNCVCPGEVDTEMLRKSYRGICEIEGIPFEEQVRRGSEMALLGRLQPPENVTKVMMFLLSDKASEITGQAVNTDAGVVFH